MTHTEALRAALERFCDATACIPLPGQPVTTTMVQTLGMALSEARAVLNQAPPAYTEGHCAEKRKPGGCQLHNLHCGYPKCDRKPA